MVEIALANGLVALIDDEDAHLAALRGWYAHGSQRGAWYARREEMRDGKRLRILLHRAVLGLTDPAIKADHKNGDGLDCRRHNLRVATTAQNAANTARRSSSASGFKGVHWITRKRRWIARIRVGRSRRQLGSFATAEEAAHAYDSAARETFGEFACLNFPRENERGAFAGLGTPEGVCSGGGGWDGLSRRPLRERTTP
jgi:hypothetical protein